MRRLLEELSGIQSGTQNKAGVDAMAAAIRRAFRDTPFAVETYPQSLFGDLLTVSSPACRETGHILLLGHMDTVFPADTHFTWWREGEGRVNAPGVYDMKGGLVVGIFAMRALAAAGRGGDLPIRFVLNSEEEVGSPVSRQLIATEARKSAMAFVLEGGGLDGSVVTARKGRWGLRLDVRGRAGHAASAGPNKASAVAALAHSTLALEGLNRLEPGVSVNVGRVEGGIGPNSVPETGSAEVDVRFVDPAGAEWFEERLREILAEPPISGTSATVTTVSRRPPMPPVEGNRALYRLAEAQASFLGIPLPEEHRAGVSDANLIAAEGTPVLDGLGPLGDLDHSDREYILVNSLVERCQLLTLTLEAAGTSLPQGPWG